jgi:hypothetical protein
MRYNVQLPIILLILRGDVCQCLGLLINYRMFPILAKIL